MTYCYWTLLKEEWNSVDGWDDDDSVSAASSISPAGQLYLDVRAIEGDGYGAGRSKDIGTITGDYTVYVRFKGDVWDGVGGVNIANGIRVHIQGDTYQLFAIIQNGMTAGDGIIIDDGAALNLAVTKTWDNDWHTVRFDVHNGQTDVDIYVDDEAVASATDADCSDETTTDGDVAIAGYGSIAGNGEYHIDYLKINTGNCDPLEQSGASILRNFI